ncbi:YraN family protein [Flavobacterium sp. 14A]|uniref:YraN family protein n=1 Tax=Flavobacterium sp. 14A TaxID=2735896 RepID=UPI00156EA4B0|nr:YraN family protein [Flavobacterium sp. 14A]NRT12317.1 putative endonuclease [Flavobacterium sp. 14A]
MAAHNDLGKLGEELAVDFLVQAGYKIVETNWTFQKAEIDIIARKGNVLAVVEVKTRSSLLFGLPQDFVDSKKIQLLIKAIDAYVNSKDLDVEVRFDIIAINTDSKKEKSTPENKKSFVIEHLIDAFYHF